MLSGVGQPSCLLMFSLVICKGFGHSRAGAHLSLIHPDDQVPEPDAPAPGGNGPGGLAQGASGPAPGQAYVRDAC